MCGITGFIEHHASTEAALVARAASMADALSHRGPDDAGTWADPSVGVAFGHRRLAIIDVSPLGHQPMVSHDGRWVLAYNGELYDYRDLRARLERRGVVLRGASDTEVLLESIALDGLAQTLATTDGMYAFALWDRRERRLLLARDRLGEKPLYFGWSGATFLFASELKALQAHPDFHGVIDREALALFMRYAYVPTPHTIYVGISKLEPGTWLSIDPLKPGEVGVSQRFWSLTEVAERGAARPFTGTRKQAIDELERTMRRAVRSRMVADVPLGAFLSGGIDSSTVVALMQAQSSSPVRTYTIGFHESSFDEAVAARAVAAHLGTDHTELYVTPREAQDVVPGLPSIYDEPFADSSQIPTLLVSKLARTDVTVALSGDGGDELFGGYTRYSVHRRFWSSAGRAPRAVRRRVAGAVTAVGPEQYDALARALDPLLPRGLPRSLVGDKVHKFAGVLSATSAEEAYVGLISHWTDPASVVIGGREPPTTATDFSAWPRSLDRTSQLMAIDAVTYLPDDILVKVDRAAMAVSLETRVPLLAPAVVELAWQLPLAWKVAADGAKPLLKAVLHRYVPRALVDRPKMGFGVPIGSWLRGALRPWAEDLLDRSMLEQQGYFDASTVRTRWQQHLSGERDWKYHLWDVLMFQAWVAHQGRSPSVEPAAQVS